LKALAFPVSNAFVDIDGDCLSDLFITSTDAKTNMVELWINKKGGFTLEKTYPIVRGAGQPVFADWGRTCQEQSPLSLLISRYMNTDADGTIDILFPVCYPLDTCAEDNYIYVIFNRQSRKLCETIWDTGCRSSADLCSPDPEYMIGASFNSSQSGVWHTLRYFLCSIILQLCSIGSGNRARSERI